MDDLAEGQMNVSWKALNLGVRGRAPAWRRANPGKRVLASFTVPVVFRGSQLCQFPLIPLIVVVIHIVINNRDYFLECSAVLQVNFIFHVTKEAFLRSVVPTVGFP